MSDSLGAKKSPSFVKIAKGKKKHKFWTFSYVFLSFALLIDIKKKNTILLNNRKHPIFYTNYFAK